MALANSGLRPRPKGVLEGVTMHMRDNMEVGGWL